VPMEPWVPRQPRAEIFAKVQRPSTTTLCAGRPGVEPLGDRAPSDPLLLVRARSSHLMPAVIDYQQFEVITRQVTGLHMRRIPESRSDKYWSR
jgi:hypothetical protein